MSEDWKTLALADAVQVAIETQQKLEKSKNQINFLLMVISFLIAVIIFMVAGG